MSSIRYQHDINIHNTNAPKIVVPYIMELFKPTSVIDIGCGLGAWLKIFEEYGIEDYRGIDGHYLDIKQVICDKNKIQLDDLENPKKANRKYDIVISLEVAEHLSNNSSDKFVDLLTSYSDNIVFSAAIPFQGGMNHINEQWMDYWAKKFESRGYKIYDIFRNHFWNENKLEFWYRQNMFFISKNEFDFGDKELKLPYNIVHPELLYFKQNQLNGNIGVTQAIKIFMGGFKYTLKKFL